MKVNNYFNVLLKAIEKKIKQEIPELVDIGIYGGGLNGDLYKKFTSISPTLRIGLSGLKSSMNTNTNQLEAKMDLSILFTTKDIDIPESRHEIALDFLEKILLLVKDGCWGVELKRTFATDQSSIKAHNYYGDKLFQADIAMWQVSWSQRCLLGKDIWE